MRLRIVLNGAEADALQQALDRHTDVFDKFERNQLLSVVRKVTAAREYVWNQRRAAWRRFVWTEDDITILRRGGGTPDRQASPDGRCACECHAERVSPPSAPGRTWCSECLADRGRLTNSSLIEDE